MEKPRLMPKGAGLCFSLSLYLVADGLTIYCMFDVIDINQPRGAQIWAIPWHRSFLRPSLNIYNCTCVQLPLLKNDHTKYITMMQKTKLHDQNNSSSTIHLDDRN